MKLSTLLILLSAAVAQAGPRTSANYSIIADTADRGGRRTTSANYTNDGSVGSIVGISSVGVPTEAMKHGYIGQLYDVTGLTLTSDSTNVNEGATVQLAAWQALDDASFLAVPAASVAWSGTIPPLTAVFGGFATAGIVYQDTPAVAQGIYLGQTGAVGLMVRNVNLDDFGSYAGDLLDDAWQNQYFGLNNLLAAPTADPDGDGQDNLFEFIAGLIPTDPNSVFRLRIEKFPGDSGKKNLIFSPRFADRAYTVKAKPSLLTVGGWTPINGSAPIDTPSAVGQERTITDLNAGGAAKFYQVEVTKP